MIRSRALRLAASSLATLTLGLAQAALAQTVEPDPAEPSAAADGSENRNAGAGLGDIIVTATKRNENLQKVPVSVSAITSDELSAKGVFNTADLNNSIPNLQVGSAYGETQPNFTVRGIGVGTEYNSNAASPVGVYVDEVYQSFRAAHGQQLYDLEQVEIIRGPQGTLFGRNTTGGAINFITRKPKLRDANGYATLGYGSFNRVSAEGAFELTPVDDVLGIRVAGTFVDSDPYVRNIQPVGLIKASPNIPDARAFGNQNTGISPGGHKSYGVRGTLRFRPSSGADFVLKGYYARAKGGQDSPQNLGPSLTDDTISLANSAFGFFYTPFAASFYGVPNLASLLPPPYSRSARGLSNREIEGNSIGNAIVTSRGAVLRGEVDLADALSVISTTGYDTAHYELLPRIDCDGTPFNVCAIGYESFSRSFNQDARLDYSGDAFKAILGVYYGYDRIRSFNTPDFYGFLSDVNKAIGNPPTYFNPAGYGLVPTGFVTRLFGTQNYTQTRKSAAVYGEASYKITETVKLTGGLRYTRDKFDYTDALTTFFDDAGNPRLLTVSDYAPGGVFRPYVIGVSPGTAKPLSRRDKSSAVTGRAIVDWTPSDDLLFYASYSRGYRGGTYNGLAFQSANQVYFVEPEKIDAFEVGVKSRFLDNRLQFNASLFHYKYKGQQQQLLDPSSVTFLINLDGKLTGLDAELVFAATDTLRLNAGLGVLDSSFGNGPCPAGPIVGLPPTVGNCVATGAGNINVGGNPFPYAAKVSGNLGFDWDAAEIGEGTLKLHGDASYTGRFYFDTFEKYDFPGGARGPLTRGGGDYVLLNGRITYATDTYSLAVYGKNLTNKFYYVNGINVEGSYGSDYLIRAAPRTFGIEASVKF